MTEGVEEMEGMERKKQGKGERTEPSLGLGIVNALLGNVNPQRQRKC